MGEVRRGRERKVEKINSSIKTIQKQKGTNHQRDKIKIICSMKNTIKKLKIHVQSERKYLNKLYLLNNFYQKYSYSCWVGFCFFLF